MHAPRSLRAAVGALGLTLSTLAPLGPLSLGVTSASLALGCGATARPDGGKGPLPVGSPSPDVSGVDQTGAAVSLRALRGKPVVVYFYPKDATPGCTREACAFRDAWDRYQKAGVQVLGVSTDDAESHATFAAEHKLPFPLVADTDQAWVRGFGVPTTLGIASRVTFLLGRDGAVARVYDSVDPGVHADQVLADAAGLPPP